MKSKISLLITLGLLALGGWFSYEKSTGAIYREYTNLWEYRRMHPETLPDVRSTRFFLAGHDTTYADTMWIALIQYIGDNIFNKKAKTFTNPVVERITTLHPHFPKPYNIALILAPTLKDEKDNIEKDTAILRESTRLAEIGIENNCDKKKMEIIRSIPYSRALWEDPSLSNPCRDDMLAYNLAYAYSELRDTKNAKLYYMIASAQKGSPEASRFLAILADAKEGDHIRAAESFLLTAIGGYDDAPFVCQESSTRLLSQVKKGTDFFTLVHEGQKIITTIQEPKDTKNPLAQSSTNCYYSTKRAIKQIYLAYITAEALKAPEAKTSEELKKAGILTTYPTLPEQAGYTLIKKNNIWSYQVYFPSK